MNDPYADLSEHDPGEPIEVIESLSAASGWPYERVADDELVVTLEGSWGKYELRAVWGRGVDRILQLMLFPDLKLLDDRRSALAETLGLINEHLWLGHFELWSHGDLVVYRNSVLLAEDGTLSPNMADTLIGAALEEAERFFPVFQFVLWGGKSPAEAIAAALIETRGEA